MVKEVPVRAIRTFNYNHDTSFTVSTWLDLCFGNRFFRCTATDSIYVHIDVCGCTDPTAFSNYNASATLDDGSCIAIVNGCTDPTAFNYNPNANVDDGSCVPFIYGCMDSTA